jgi:ribosomal protein S27AE
MGEKRQAEAHSRKLVCGLCGVEFENMKTQFSYLGHSFHAETPRCPKCGQVFIPEELAKGRMTEVETALEDK